MEGAQKEIEGDRKIQRKIDRQKKGKLRDRDIDEKPKEKNSCIYNRKRKGDWVGENTV